MEETELLPCPFCGNIPILMDLYGFEILCSCGADMMVNSPEKDEVISAWNRRQDNKYEP